MNSSVYASIAFQTAFAGIAQVASGVSSTVVLVSFMPGEPNLVTYTVTYKNGNATALGIALRAYVSNLSFDVDLATAGYSYVSCVGQPTITTVTSVPTSAPSEIPTAFPILQPTHQPSSIPTPRSVKTPTATPTSTSSPSVTSAPSVEDFTTISVGQVCG